MGKRSWHGEFTPKERKLAWQLIRAGIVLAFLGIPLVVLMFAGVLVGPWSWLALGVYSAILVSILAPAQLLVSRAHRRAVGRRSGNEAG